VTPYALTGVERNYTIDAEARRRGEIGGEVKYGVTPSLTLDLTYNTDFAQVEVDEQRTNLTRFPLFFPEKRPFFLENAGIFSAGTPQAVDLFFTRRIGIDTLGQPVSIVGGGRLTGRVGPLTVGGLEIFTEHQAYSVLRLQRELAEEVRRLLHVGDRVAGGTRPSGTGRGRARQWWPRPPRGQRGARESAAALLARGYRQAVSGVVRLRLGRLEPHEQLRRAAGA